MTGGVGSNQYVTRPGGVDRSRSTRATRSAATAVRVPQPWERYPESADWFTGIDEPPGEVGSIIVADGEVLGEVTPLVTPDAVDAFRRGGCNVMAAVLHDRTGWDIVAVGKRECDGSCYEADFYDYDADDPTWCDCSLRHFMVRAPDGLLWDVGGVNEEGIVCQDDEDLVVRDVPDSVFATVLGGWENPPGLVGWAHVIAPRSLSDDPYGYDDGLAEP